MIAKIDKNISKLTLVAFYISMFSVLFVMCLVILDAFLRKIVLQSILGSYEIASFALLCAVFASWSYCQTQKGHVRVFLVIMRFPNTVRMILNAFSCLVGTVIIVYLVYAAIVQTEYSLTEGTVSGVLLIKFYPFYIYEAVTMTLFAITLAWDFVKSLIALKDKELSAEIQKEWI